MYGRQVRENEETLSLPPARPARPGSVLSHDDVDVYSIGVAEALSVHHISNSSMKAHSVASSVHVDDNELENEKLGSHETRTFNGLPPPPGVRRVSEVSHASRRSRFMERFSVERLCDFPPEREEFGSVVHLECVEVEEEDGDRDSVEEKIEEEGYEVLDSDDEERKQGKGWKRGLKKGVKLFACCQGSSG